MQKKLLGVAVAAVLAAPGLALAQAPGGSGVTIGGIIKVGLDSYKIGNPSAARGNNRETRVTDNSSRMIFGISESIGGGLSGIAQVDVRFQPDDAGGGFAESGNTWVGLRSASMGTLTLGRHDLHYGKQPDEVATYAGALMAAAVSLMDHIGTTAIAGATRTSNVVRYDTPNWGGFALTAAYSTNPIADERDIANGNTTRKGNAWNLNPSFTSGPFQVGYSHWRQKADAPGVAGAPAVTVVGGVPAVTAGAIQAAATSDQRSNVLYGYWTFGGFKIGAAINDSELKNGATGVKTADRRAWTIPVRWAAGPHHVAAHYTKAKDDSVTAGDQGAKMWAAAYSYLFSKRTSVGVTYAKLDNNANANYNFFTNTGGLGSTNSTLTAGEDGTLVALTVRHAF